jgi:hypothetical protein
MPPGVYVVRFNSLDVDYLLHWAGKLDVQGELNDLIAGKIRPKTT